MQTTRLCTSRRVLDHHHVIALGAAETELGDRRGAVGRAGAPCSRDRPRHARRPWRRSSGPRLCSKFVDDRVEQLGRRTCPARSAPIRSPRPAPRPAPAVRDDVVVVAVVVRRAHRSVLEVALPEVDVHDARRRRRPRPTARAAVNRTRVGRVEHATARRAPRSRARWPGRRRRTTTPALALHVPGGTACDPSGCHSRTRTRSPSANRGSVRSVSARSGGVPRSGRRAGTVHRRGGGAPRSWHEPASTSSVDDAGQPVLVVRRRSGSARGPCARCCAGTRPPDGRRPDQRGEVDPKRPPFPLLVEHRLVGGRLDRAEPLEATEIVDAVHGVVTRLVRRAELSAISHNSQRLSSTPRAPTPVLISRWRRTRSKDRAENGRVDGGPARPRCKFGVWELASSTGRSPSLHG